MHTTHQKKEGFTLIELSIVLVIIGLLVGGALVGRDLIKAAELRKVYDSRVKIESAVNTFKLKYNCLAGDCANATQFFGADASCPNTPKNATAKQATCDGNGDGQIGDMISGSSVASLRYEWYRFWQQLANAGLIEGSYSGTSGARNDWDCQATVNCPETIRNARLLMFYVDIPNGSSTWFPAKGGNYLQFSKPIDLSGYEGILAGPLLAPHELKNIDIKHDDGKPGTGKIITRKQGYAYAPNCSDGTNEATADYRLDLDSQECLLFVRISDGRL